MKSEIKVHKFHDGWGEVVTHSGTSLDGKPCSASAWGASVSARFVTGYLSSDEKSIEDSSGTVFGRARVTARWKTPRSYVSNEMLQVECTLPDGAVYTGRCAGSGMLYKGKRKAEKKA